MKTKFFIALFIFTAIIFFVFMGILIKKKNAAEEVKYTPSQLSAPIEIPATGIVRYSELKDHKKPVVILFYVDWCTYCRRFMPIFGIVSEKLNKEFTFAVVNCDYSESLKLLKKYNINHFPTVYITDKDLDFSYEMSMAGLYDANAFESELKKHLKLRSKLKI